MIFTLLIFVLLYTFAAGGVGKQVHALGQTRCKGHKGAHDWEHCGHYYSGILAGVFWPLALPLAAGMKSSDQVPTPINKEIKEDNKRKEELKRVQHEAQLEQAEVMREEMLDRRLELGVRRMELESRRLELTSAGVPDMVEEDEPKKKRR